MLSSRKSKIAFLVLEILIIQFILLIVIPATPSQAQYQPVPYYIQAINVPPDVWTQFGLSSDGSCFGGQCWVTVQNAACHKFCRNKQENALYVWDDISHYPAIFAEVGWMWANGWPAPQWYVMVLNHNNVPAFYLLGEHIPSGSNCIMKLQFVQGSSSQWRFYRSDPNYSGEIARLNYVDVRWGAGIVAGEKWDVVDTNWSDFWQCVQHGANGLGGGWYSWNWIGTYQQADPYYNFKPWPKGSRDSGGIRPNGYTGAY